MGPMALLPLRRKACCGFLSPMKIHRPRPGLTREPWVIAYYNKHNFFTVSLVFCKYTLTHTCIGVDSSIQANSPVPSHWAFMFHFAKTCTAAGYVLIGTTKTYSLCVDVSLLESGVMRNSGDGEEVRGTNPHSFKCSFCRNLMGNHDAFGSFVACEFQSWI
jgi:hypothetical protein